MTIRDFWKIIFIDAVLILFVLLSTRISKIHNTEESRIVQDAVREAIMTCYAVEGAYPESVEYLQENYRLAYDEERYLVNIESFAANRSPDVYVVERGAAE